MKAFCKKYVLNFKRPGGTSRGVLHTKETWFIILKSEDKIGIGETGLFRGLSVDDVPSYEATLAWVCEHINTGLEALLKATKEFPSIQFGLEQAFLSLESESPFELFPSEFTTGKKAININGLVWMGDASFMKSQLKEKLKSGFTTLKLKIGAIDFNTEIALLKSIRKEFTANEIELRVDANGGFLPKEALEKLKRLSELQIHSIEQPIKPKQIDEMAALCEASPLPIALDEELIGVFTAEDKRSLIETIQPPYIILKPSLIGGIAGTNEWIRFAEASGTQWWMTSALESNIGLNAIAQFTYSLKVTIPQGLGTGGLFTNNFKSPLEVHRGSLLYRSDTKWGIDLDTFLNK